MGVSRKSFLDATETVATDLQNALIDDRAQADDAVPLDEAKAMQLLSLLAATPYAISHSHALPHSTSSLFVCMWQETH